MNQIRIVFNLALAIALFCAAAYLLGQDSYYLRERWQHTGIGTLFSGAALYFLATGLLCLGSFALAVLYSWLTGKAAMPDPADLLTHPAYQGTLILRFWYLVLPAFAFVLLAFLLAEQVPKPAPQLSLQPSAAEHDASTQK